MAKSCQTARPLSYGLVLFLFSMPEVGWNILQSFQALKLTIWPWQPEEIKAQRSQLTFLRAHSKSEAEPGLEPGYPNTLSSVLSIIWLCPTLFFFFENYVQSPCGGAIVPPDNGPLAQQWTSNLDWPNWILFPRKLRLRRHRLLSGLQNGNS